MVRRALSRNVKTTPPDPEIAARYMRFWSKGDLYFHPERFPRLDAPSLFGNARPLVLEVGSGTGEFLCWRAAEEPDTNFVGVDVWPKVVYHSVKLAAKQGLDNILFIRAPFEFTYPLLVPDSIQRVFLHYPDPNIRSRGQHKLFNPDFLDAIHRALEPDGRLSVVTDHDELFFEEMLPLIEADPRWEKTHAARYLTDYEPEVKSRYQKLWEKHDVPPKRVVVRKRVTSNE